MLNDDELLIIDAAVKAFKIQMRAHSKSQRRFWVVFSMNFFLALLNVTWCLELHSHPAVAIKAMS